MFLTRYQTEKNTKYKQTIYWLLDNLKWQFKKVQLRHIIFLEFTQKNTMVYHDYQQGKEYTMIIPDLSWLPKNWEPWLFKLVKSLWRYIRDKNIYNGYIKYTLEDTQIGKKHKTERY